MYTPGHSAVLAYALETSTITETPDGTTPAALPAIPSSPVIIGYTNVPEVIKGFGNKKGFAIGSPRPVYDLKGRQTYRITFEVRVGALAFLQKGIRDPSTDVLQRFALFVGVKGQYTEVIRFCAIDQMVLNFQEGEAKELTATVTIEGIALQQRGTILNPSVSDIKAFGSPLTWGSVKQLALDGTDYRQALMEFSVTYLNNLERKGDRPDWGDDVPTSRTSYDLLPHLVNTTGDATFHSRLDPALLAGAADAQHWGDAVITANDDSTYYEVTVSNVMPVTATDSGVEASAQKNNKVAFVADDIVINTVAPG